MARTLDVYLHQHLVGHLIQDDGGRLGFAYEKRWLNRPDAIGLSYSLPLSPERYSRNECRGFFAGILPEEPPNHFGGATTKETFAGSKCALNESRQAEGWK